MKAATMPDGDRLLGTQEVAEILGTTTRSLQRLIAWEKFPASDARVGRQHRWRWSTVKNWIDGEDPNDINVDSRR